MERKHLPFDGLPAQATQTIGNAQIGTITLPLCFGLTPLEHQFLEQIEEHRSQFQMELAALALKIAKAQELEAVAVYAAIAGAAWEETKAERQQRLKLEAKLSLLYPQELCQINQQARKIRTLRPLLVATAILKFRKDPSWTVADMQQWGESWIEELNRFAEAEQQQWQPQNPLEPIAAETLGKSHGESAATAPSTGGTSTAA